MGQQKNMSEKRDSRSPAEGSEGGEKVSRRSGRPKLGTYTIHDIAALAGVSSITVSRYFNAPEKVSEKVRERLRGIIAETGYVPSKMAGQLASARSQIVGAIMQNTASVTFADLVKGMSYGFEESGLQLLLANADYQQMLEERALRALSGWHPAGMILTRNDHTADAEALLLAMRCPVVESWAVVPDRPFHQVGFPHPEVGIELTRHFLEQGAKRIRFALRAATHDFRAQQRAEGYAHTMRAAGLMPDIDRAVSTDEYEAGSEAIRKFAREPQATRPQAIIFATDNMAAGAMLLAPQLGLTLPADCAVAGFGDAPLAARLVPDLTTMRPEPYTIGQTAARVMLDLIANPDQRACPQAHIVPCRLIVRSSSSLRRT